MAKITQVSEAQPLIAPGFQHLRRAKGWPGAEQWPRLKPQNQHPAKRRQNPRPGIGHAPIQYPHQRRQRVGQSRTQRYRANHKANQQPQIPLGPGSGKLHAHGINPRHGRAGNEAQQQRHIARRRHQGLRKRCPRRQQCTAEE